MQRLEVSGAVRPIYGSLGVKRLKARRYKAIILLFVLVWRTVCKVICRARSQIRGSTIHISRSQWPRGLKRRSAAARLLRTWVRIPPGAWMFVCCECCVLSGRGLCDELITRPEESYRLWCVVVCAIETSRMRRPWRALGRSATRKEKVY